MRIGAHGFTKSSVNVPYLILCDPDEDRITLGVCWGNRNSDPVWFVDIEFTGWLAKPLVFLARWRWDAAVRKQDALHQEMSGW